jgi:signal peptidase I
MKQQAKAKQTWFETIRELATLLLIVFLVRTFIFGLYQVPTGSMETTMLVGERFFADKFTYLYRTPLRGEIISLNEPTFDYSKNAIVRLYQEYVGWPIWPWGPLNYTKRVIGIPGDHIKGVIEEGKPVVYLNEQKLDEPYLNKYPLIAVWTPLGDGTISYDFRSYDASKPDWQQPFYRINTQHAQFPVNQYSFGQGYSVTKDGRLLKEPGLPIGEGDRHEMHRQGESSWNGSDEYDIKLGANQYWGMGDNRRGSKDSRSFGPIDGRLIHGRILLRIWSVDSDESWWIVDLIKHPIDFWSRMRWNRFFQRVR